jgi:hypothetical protein
MDFLNDVSEIDEGVKSGEIQGFSDFPLKAQGVVYKVEATSKNGKNWIEIYVALKDSIHQRKKFDLWIAKKGIDKDTACFFSVSRLHATLWPLAGKTADTAKFAEVWAELQRRLSVASILVDFELANENFFNTRTGKESSNQKLQLLKFVGKADKIVEAVPKTDAASGYSQEDVPF